MITELFGDLFHKDDSLVDGKMACRAIVTFLLAIALVRLAGRRSFGLRSPFDTVISLLLGATLSRGIVGASSYTGAVGACLLLAFLHRLQAYIYSSTVSHLISGKDVVLFENGHYNRANMDVMLVSEQDLQETVRLIGNEASIDRVQEALIERNGQISIVKKK